MDDKMHSIEISLMKNGVFAQEYPMFWVLLTEMFCNSPHYYDKTAIQKLSDKELEDNKEKYAEATIFYPASSNALRTVIFRVALEYTYPSATVDCVSTASNLSWYITFSDDSEYTKFLLING